MYTSDFYRVSFAPVCLSRCTHATRGIYDHVVDLFVNHCGDLPLEEISPAVCQQFVDHCLTLVRPETVAKYCRHLNAIFLRMGYPGWRNRQAFGLLQNPPYCVPPRLVKRLPKLVADRDIVSLIQALATNTDYPKCVAENVRPTWWRTLCLFAISTAVRRRVLFGLKWEAVDLPNNRFFVCPELDKAHAERIKFLHSNLVRLLLRIRTADPRVFAWDHGTKRFHEMWHAGCEMAGVKLTLHDLKRYASQCAVRSGADVSTTLKHYARGNVEQLIANLKLPEEVWR